MGHHQQQRIPISTLSPLPGPCCLPKWSAAHRLALFLIGIGGWFVGLGIVGHGTSGRAIAAEPPAIELQAIQPLAFEAGKTSPCRLLKGTFLDEAARLLFSHPGITASCKPAPLLPFDDQSQWAFGNFEITIAPEVPSGIYEVRAVGRMGVSNPLSILVTRTPLTGVVADPLATTHVETLAAGNSTTHFFQSSRRLEYALPVAEGETLQLWCWAHSLDSPAIPSLILRDPNGREVARQRAQGIGPVQMHYTSPTAGIYRLTIQDFLFRGGPEYQFVLSRPSHEEGIALQSGPQPHQPQWFDRQRWTEGSTPILFQEGQAAESPLAIPIPTLVHGAFEHAGDQDVVEWKATAGDELAVEVASRQLDNVTDIRMLLELIEQAPGTPEKRSRIAVVDDAPPIGGPALSLGRQDPTYVWKVDKPGTIRLTLQDLLNHSANQAKEYWLRVGPRQVAFRAYCYLPCPNNLPALAHPTGTYLARGDVGSIRVVVQRERGFDAPLQVQALGLPEGITSQPAMIHSSQTETELHFRVSESASAWEGPVEIQVATVEPTSVPSQSLATPCAIHLAASPERGLPRARQTQALYLAIRPDLAPMTLEFGSEKPVEVARGGNVEIPIRVLRRSGGTDKCLLRPAMLPSKTTMAEVTTDPKEPKEGEPNVSEGKATLQVAGDALPGDYTFWMVAETKVKMAINPEALARAEAYLSKLQGLKSAPACQYRDGHARCCYPDGHHTVGPNQKRDRPSRNPALSNNDAY